MLPVQEAPVPSEDAVESEEESGPKGAYDFVLEYDGYFGGGMWAASDAEEEPLELSEDPGAPDGGDKDPADPPSPPTAAPVLPKLQTEKAIHYIDEAEGPFPRMLWEAMQIIGVIERPRFEAHRYEDPG